MEQYTVTGMTCAACQARVEKAVSKVQGVESCSVSLLTNSMGVTGTASAEAVIKAVTDAGYGARLKNGSEQTVSNSYSADEEALKDHDTPVLVKRLVSSLVFLLILMYISMGHMMFGWPVPSVMADNPVMTALTELILAAIVMVINQKFFISGFKGIIHLSPNMDTLVALGSSASFVYSTYVLYAMINAQYLGEAETAVQLSHGLYFESAAMILTLITVGKMLEARSKGKTTDALKSLMRLAPQNATVIRDGKEVTVPISEVRTGDIFAVKPGESIPVDGIITSGSTAVNEAALTGESIPVDKAEGDSVSAATINQSGYILAQATRVGQDTTLSQIIKMVSDAAATKAPIAKIADRVSGVFVPAVLSISLITFIVWLASGHTVGFAIARAISVLVISCPCSLGLATPVAIMVGNGIGARNGILFKTAASLEAAGKTEIVALDKTGTITNGRPQVTDIITTGGVSEEQLLTDAYSIEIKSEHPLAVAIKEEAEKKNIKALQSENFRALTGSGIYAEIGGFSCYGGNLKFISDKAEVPQELASRCSELAEEGKTPLYFTKNGVIEGVIAVSDTIKDDSREAVRQLKNMGIRVVMLTGDNAATAKAIGKLAEVDEVISDVLPEGKAEAVRSLKAQGKVAMVGDGINDAPALTSSDTGIAIGAGADVAIDAADVVLMKSRLTDVTAAIRLSRRTLTNIHENLFWAFFYNSIGIPLAAGVFTGITGWELNPMFAAAAMSLSSFCVVSNALRLNLINVHDPSHDHKIRKKTVKKKGKLPMEKTMVIEGMMCSHCEARVKKALEKIDGVTEATPSHTAGTAVVKLSKEVSNDVLKKAVEDQDYTVKSIN